MDEDKKEIVHKIDGNKDPIEPEQTVDYKQKFEALEVEHKKVLEQIEAFRRFTLTLAAKFHKMGMENLNTEDGIIGLFSPKEQPSN